MKRNVKVLVLSAFLAAVLVFPVSGQLVVSVGGSAYAGTGGLMPGAGAQFDDWVSMSEEEASQGLMIGLGIEYIALTTTQTRTPGSGWIFPATVKYGFPIGRNLELGLGGGVAMVLNDADVLDYSGSYYATSVLGGAPFAEAGLYLFVSPHVNIQFLARLGALFNETGTVPFLGVRMLLGYYIEMPHPSRADDYSESDDSE